MTKTRTLARGLLVGAGLINAAPVVGALDAHRVEALYEVPVEDANLALLLRHRAAMLGILGAGMIVGAFVPRVRDWTAAAGVVSMGSYIALAHLVGEPNENLVKVERIDYVALAMVAGALALDPA